MVRKQVAAESEFGGQIARGRIAGYQPLSER
jgi:hypothetical protein